MSSATKRGNRIVAGSIVFLLALTGVLAYLNAGDLALKKELEMNAEFVLTAGKPASVSPCPRSGAAAGGIRGHHGYQHHRPHARHLHGGGVE